MRGGGEAGLAVESTHVSTRRTRKAVPFKEGFFRSALSTGSLWIEKTSEEEETPAVETPRAKKRKAGWTSRTPYVTGRRDEDIYYCEHRSGTAPSIFCGDEGCRYNLATSRGHT